MDDKPYTETPSRLEQPDLGRELTDVSGPKAMTGDIDSPASTGRDTVAADDGDFRAIVRSATQAIFVTQDGLFSFVNKACEDLTGFTEEELLGLPFHEIIHPEDRAEVLRRYRLRMIGEKTPFSYVCRGLMKDGGTKWTQVHTSIISWKGSPAVLGLATDITDRFTVEQELERQKKRFQTLAEHAPFGMAVVAEDGKFHYVNPTFINLFGYEADEIPDGRSWFLRVLPDREERERAVSEWLEYLRGSSPDGKGTHTIMVTSRDGERKTIELLRVHLDSGDFLVTCRDKTEEVRAERAIRAHKDSLEALLNATPDIAILLGRDGTVLAANRELAETLGVDLETLIGTDVFDYSDEETASRRQARLRKVVESGSPIRVEETGRNKRLYDTSAYPVLGPAGDVERVALFARDITEQRRAEEELRASERKYRRILETIADGYHEVDLHGNLMLVNDVFCEILGACRSDLIGRNFRDLMDRRNAELVLNSYNRVFTTGKPVTDLRFGVTRPDGTTRHVAISIALIRDPEGAPEGFHGTIRDVTERRQLEEQLRQAAKMEAVGRLAGGLAHDFNNLLTAIMGYADLLLQDIHPEGPNRSRVEQIGRAAERASALTRKLLAFSRKQVLDMKVLDLNEIISDLETMLRRLIREDIELVSEATEDSAPIRGDQGQIEQIVMNLAVNARDAMPTGGRLEIRTARERIDSAYAGVGKRIPPGDYVVMTVADTGIGMDSGTCARIFDPFFTTKEKEVGTGLGLSTVYGIVKQHNGHIAVQSNPGRGTIFRIYFPEAEGRPVGRPKQPRPSSQPQGSETILVVEDEQVVRQLVCEALNLLGYRVLEADGPEVALKTNAYHDGAIDLLLTDVVMPAMDGRTLYERLKPQRPNMRVLYVSGYTESFIVNHGVLDPDVHFVPKPFALDVLARKVREVLDAS